MTGNNVLRDVQSSPTIAATSLASPGHSTLTMMESWVWMARSAACWPTWTSPASQLTGSSRDITSVGMLILPLKLLEIVKLHIIYYWG